MTEEPNSVKYQLVKELLPTPEHWLKASWSRTPSGEIANWHSETATMFCLSGAIRRVDPTRQLLYLTQGHLQTLVGHKCIPEWNDAAERTFEDVHKFIDHCAKLEKLREQRERRAARAAGRKRASKPRSRATDRTTTKRPRKATRS